MLKGHEGPVNYITFHPHQPDLLLSCANDGTCRLWNVLDQSCSPVVLDVRQGFQQPPAPGGQLICCYSLKRPAQSGFAPIAGAYFCRVCFCEPRLPRAQVGGQISLAGRASANAWQHGAALGSAQVTCPEDLPPSCQEPQQEQRRRQVLPGGQARLHLQLPACPLRMCVLRAWAPLQLVSAAVHLAGSPRALSPSWAGLMAACRPGGAREWGPLAPPGLHQQVSGERRRGQPS